MQFVKVGDHIINLDEVLYCRESQGTLTVVFDPAQSGIELEGDQAKQFLKAIGQRNISK